MSRKALSEKIKQAVHERADGFCEYCQSRDDLATRRFVIEHIYPVAKGGTNDLENLALSCPGCNGYKYNKTEGVDLITGEAAPIFNPRTQSWLDHFIWNHDFTLIVGLTPTGRITIPILKMNRPRLIKRRAIYQLLELHPPEHTLRLE